MKKETVFAILLGIGAGVLIALWVIRGTQTKSKSPDQTINNESITPSITISSGTAEPLLISTPEDGFLSQTEEITIKGKSKKGSLLIAQSPVGEISEVLKSDEFEVKLKLMQGMNHVLVTSYNDTLVDTRSLTIFYVEEE
ncbi:hypothetical protein E6Q11_05365 [Candidatus Dojkabacteria bacterium]|uniref:Uncharacterized protein n=1 Tax=Candidatus Dojkabacteria bacterium TaxID=2099670 RepID=A0A5C7J4H1_9BACT|nr:MAG: hypothetical protein E6Q11_05365 [Candidatus Dojkabacteria bacterium]